MINNKIIILITLYFLSSVLVYGQTDSIILTTIDYYKNGQVKKKKNYLVGGNELSLVIFFNKRGRLKKEYFYKSNNLMFTKTYNLKNQVIKINNLKIKESKSKLKYNVDSTNLFSPEINSVDSLNNKQGKWYKIETVLLHDYTWKQCYCIGQYSNDKKNGPWQFYDFYSKNLIAEVNFSEGEVKGTAKIYNNKGELWGLINFEDVSNLFIDIGRINR